MPYEDHDARVRSCVFFYEIIIMGGFQALCTVVYCPHFPSHHPSLNQPTNESKMEDDQPTNYHLFQGVVEGTIVEPRGDRLIEEIIQLFHIIFQVICWMDVGLGHLVGIPSSCQKALISPTQKWTNHSKTP